MKIHRQFKEANKRIKDFIDIKCIDALSNKDSELNKVLNYNLIEGYLKKRGYVVNTLLNKKIYTKAFTCVSINKKNLEIWHDVNNSKHQFIDSSYLTGLPITLDYMEKIYEKF